MVAQGRVTQDRRRISRLETRIDCQFDFEGIRYDAVIIDLSLRGAYLSSRFLPPSGSSITITLQSAHLDRPLVLEGKVRRGISGMSGHGSSGRFGFEAIKPPLDLTKLVSNLIARKSAY